MIEPPLQPRQPVYLALERAQLLFGSEKAEGVELLPDHMVNPGHLATSSLGSGAAAGLPHTFASISEACL